MKKFFTILAVFVVALIGAVDALAFPKEGKSYFNFNLGYGINNPKVYFATSMPPVTGSLKPMDRGFAFDAGLGYYLLDEIRVALNPVYASDLSGKSTSGKGATLFTNKQTIKQYALFTNLYYDFLISGKMNPFVMVGLGYMRTETEDRSTFDSLSKRNKSARNKMAYQAGGGLAYHMSSAVDAELGWRALKSSAKKSGRTAADMSDPTDIVVSTDPGLTHLITLGMRFTF